MFYIAIICIAVVIDQWSKKRVQKVLMNRRSIPIIKNKVTFVLMKNKGAAYGILEERQRLLMVITTPLIIAMLTFLGYIIVLGEGTLLKWGVSLMVGGALGNWLDRIRYKYVIDFIYINLPKWPVFNFADCFIFIGGLFLIYWSIFGDGFN